MPRKQNENPSLTGQTPAAQAAGFFLGKKLNTVARTMGRVRKAAAGDGEVSVKDVHKLRVATRRAATVITTFAEHLPGAKPKKVLRRLRRLRRSAGHVRDRDVLVQWMGKVKRKSAARDRGAIDRLATNLAMERAEAIRDLAKKVQKIDPGRMRRRAERVLRKAADAADSESSIRLESAARDALSRILSEVSLAGNADLNDLKGVHTLRLAWKQLRYTVELLLPVLCAAGQRPLLNQMASVQDKLGAINDAAQRESFLETTVEELKKSFPEQAPAPGKKPRRAPGLRVLEALLDQTRRELSELHHEFPTWWKSFRADPLFETLRGLTAAPASDLPGANLAGIFEIKPFAPLAAISPEQETHAAGANGTANGHASREGRRPQRVRLAAIDVGTNSTRLIIAEAGPDGTYRILDDEKEMTRLGRGLHSTGEMDAESIEHTVAAIARMKSIARGYGAKHVRVIGTAAVREAKNAGALIDLVRERCDLQIEIVTAEQEALLAYRSAANAFDLRSAGAAVVDIGGGSTEVVLSAAVGENGDASQQAIRGAGLGGGVIERVYTVPLGAVRLTEMFGGAESCSGDRFDDMVRYVRETIKTHLGKPPFVPSIFIGTGGTLTSLGDMMLHREIGDAADGLFSGGVQGLEVRRPGIKHLMQFVRELPLRQRARVPGLPAERADIIVAGLVLVDALMKRLGVNRVRIHEGGIRDGLLLTMARGAAFGGGRPANEEDLAMRGVRRFAKACGYEAPHSRHVAMLSLRIFDQMAEWARQDKRLGPAFGPRERTLLEAAALLHDIGYLINYARHHKHSYHLILHADLPGLTTREVQVIANVARYHRCAEPSSRHRNFAVLSKSDRALVRAHAAILRIADGLDRAHVQSVRDVRVRTERDAVHFDVFAEQEPTVEVWGAARKLRLFTRVFGLLPHMAWNREPIAPASATDVEPQVSGAV